MKEFRGEKGPQVQVSWRKTQWHFEHAVHALYVYRELLSMRLDAKNWGIPGLDGAIADSKTAIEELESRIGGFENAFYGEGEKWFKSKAAH